MNPCFYQFVCLNTCLGKTIHYLPDFTHFKTIIYFGHKAVLLKNSLRDDIDWKLHVLILLHQCIQVDFKISAIINNAPGVEMVLLKIFFTSA